ncbi:MAG TPA: NrsF family protein [Dongiaceae bacterium]|nr:NrsF family protein [Dongiaceae bacterium]
MGSTEELIATLGGELRPVRRLPPPALRAAGWIALATALIAVLALLRGLRADMTAQLADPAYWVQVAGAWMTGAAATLAAFNVSLPDRSRLWLLLPAPFALLWLWGFAYGCLGDWIAIPEGAPVMADSARCLETIVMASVPMSLVLWLMLRRNRPLRPEGTAWIGALAVAGFADTAHLLIHVVEASLLVLLVNLLPATVILLVGGLVGRRPLATGA